MQLFFRQTFMYAYISELQLWAGRRSMFCSRTLGGQWGEAHGTSDSLVVNELSNHQGHPVDSTNHALYVASMGAKCESHEV